MARCKFSPSDWDPRSFHSTDPVADFQSAATELIAGWRAGGVDRTVPLIGTELPDQYRGEGKAFGNVIELPKKLPCSTVSWDSWAGKP